MDHAICCKRTDVECSRVAVLFALGFLSSSTVHDDVCPRFCVLIYLNFESNMPNSIIIKEIYIGAMPV